MEFHCAKHTKSRIEHHNSIEAKYFMTEKKEVDMEKNTPQTRVVCASASVHSPHLLPIDERWTHIEYQQRRKKKNIKRCRICFGNN